MTAKRLNISSGSRLEAAYGYSRAVRVGDTLWIAGTIGMDYAAGTIPEDPVAQLAQILRNFERPLAEAGARLADVVQLTTYVASAQVFEAIGPELGRIFGDVRPVNTALVVDFPIPGAKIEIAAVAVIGCGA
jgi:enamine deaminase RidA (YjgF/YER057c/UK114 family)